MSNVLSVETVESLADLTGDLTGFLLREGAVTLRLNPLKQLTALHTERDKVIVKSFNMQCNDEYVMCCQRNDNMNGDDGSHLPSPFSNTRPNLRHRVSLFSLRLPAPLSFPNQLKLILHDFMSILGNSPLHDHEVTLGAGEGVLVNINHVHDVRVGPGHPVKCTLPVRLSALPQSLKETGLPINEGQAVDYQHANC